LDSKEPKHLKVRKAKIESLKVVEKSESKERKSKDKAQKVWKNS
jgi:hypothetical protein